MTKEIVGNHYIFAYLTTFNLSQNLGDLDKSEVGTCPKDAPLLQEAVKQNNLHRQDHLNVENDHVNVQMIFIMLTKQIGNVRKKASNLTCSSHTQEIPTAYIIVRKHIHLHTLM